MKKLTYLLILLLPKIFWAVSFHPATLESAIDTIPPKIECLNNVKEYFFNTRTHSLEVKVNDLIASVYDDQSPVDSIQVYFDSIPTKKLIVYYCESLIYHNSNKFYEDLLITAEDKCGNKSTCKARIYIEDRWDICNYDPPSYIIEVVTYPVSMNIRYEGALISVEGMNYKHEIFGTEAKFNHFSNGKYKVCLRNNTSAVEGVTSADLFKIRKHILGIDEFTQDHQLIAADVNLSCSVTASDITAIKKIILDVEPQFQKVPSWIFIPVNFTPVSATPCSITECWETEIKDNDIKLEFKAIKMGNVN